MIVGCYSLDLYCDNDDAHSTTMAHRLGQFTGETASEARVKARRSGWHIDLKASRVLCPKCAKRRKETKP